MSVFRPGLFKNRVAIVTGGATGIGKAIATELATLGCTVVIASRNAERLQSVADEFCKNNLKVAAIPCNIRKEDDVKNLISKTLSSYGKLDYLVNNGGGQFPCHIENMSLKGWNAVIETNLTGTFLMCREAYTSWFCDNGGSIVNIIADMFRGMPLMAHTGAARAGVDNLTKSLSVEWASSGTRVNCVAPGSSIYSETASKNYGDMNVFELAKPGIPAKRLGTVDEISSSVCFLLSPAASFITGATLRVDAAGSLYSPQMVQIQDHDKLPPYEWQKNKEKSKL